MDTSVNATLVIRAHRARIAIKVRRRLRLCKRKTLSEEITCNKEKFRKHHVEGDCRSIDEIKNGRCLGYCGEGEVRQQILICGRQVNNTNKR